MTDEPPVEYLTTDDVLLDIAHDLRERVYAAGVPDNIAIALLDARA